MTRKQRKQARKNKHKPREDINPEMNAMLWQIARAMARSPRDEDEGKAYFCPKCKKAWCRPFGLPGRSTYCDTCHYRNGCLKRPEIREWKLCHDCLKKEKENEEYMLGL
jgi:hypothetical protein